MNPNLAPQKQTGTLSTFAGVFTPSILTILGIILFLRLGYVVGNAGLGQALIMIALANSISLLTSISLSAVATNLKVKGGGDYYLISRTLGVEFGGAIGIVLFLAQSVSIAFYTIGFGEALSALIPATSKHLPQIIAALAVTFLFILAWLGADWATRFQYAVMAILAAALLSFFIGGIAGWEGDLFRRNWSNPDPKQGFWTIFAIFFPAVTGFTQGVSMSGDLKDPGHSLPMGTFLAVGVSMLVYFGAAAVFGGALPREALSHDYQAMHHAALNPFLIHAGVIAATLSSAMASFLGAPRILQSLSGDRIFPFLLPLAKGYGPTKNPRRGVLLSAGIALATISLGKLNIIAPVVSMFFLISYGLLNYATYYEARSASPSFRPRFRWFNPKLSLAGCLACLGVMLAINLIAGIMAVTVLFAIYQYLKRTAGPARWADSRRSFHLQRIRENLLAASGEPEHPRDWRPHILAFSNDPERRKALLRFSSWLEGGSGLTTMIRILEGNGIKMLKLKEEAEEELRRDILENGSTAFPLVLAIPELNSGLQALVQSFGIGPVRGNTVLLNQLDQTARGIPGVRELRYSKSLKTVYRFGCNIIILHAGAEHWQRLEKVAPADRRIDVWWWGDATSRLMLLLAYLVTRNEFWEDSRIRVVAVSQEAPSDEAMEDLRHTLQEVRIEAEAEIIQDNNPDTVTRLSSQTDLCFIPFRLSKNELMGPFGCPVEDLTTGRAITAFVLAAEDIDLDAEPEEGQAAETAAALDNLYEAEKRAEQAEAEAAKLAEEAEHTLAELRETTKTGDDEKILNKIKAAREAKEEAIRAARKAAKAAAKAEEAARMAEALGVVPKKEEASD